MTNAIRHDQSTAALRRIASGIAVAAGGLVLTFGPSDTLAKVGALVLLGGIVVAVAVLAAYLHRPEP